ncbi:hypothetical protein [Oceaniglobus trochenteri]|uniref:hypothetical protein n=1 Tax=Oceaniglobus trochenteri TaxID=2763260 RepID=UPI001CFF9C61|nr:hypothetical protein [Oceaniglobus trochenteri]
MNAPLTIAPDEHGVVRVFQLSPRLVAMIDHAETLAPLAEALGTPALNPDHVQLTALRDLDSLGLAGLLEQGHGIAPATLAADRDRLSALTGSVAVLRSRAFDRAGGTLHPNDECTLVASYGEETAPPPRFEQLPQGGAKGTLPGGRTPEDAHRASRRTLLIGLAAVTALAVVLLLVMGGKG